MIVGTCLQLESFKLYVMEETLAENLLLKREKTSDSLIATTHNINDISIEIGIEKNI